MANASNTTAPTQFIETKLKKYAYRRFGKGNGLPLLCLQHFTGTLDNWDPAVTDPLAVGREVVLFGSAGLGRSTGQLPENMSGMGATVYELDSSHVPMLSQPERVLDVIRTAAKAVQQTMVAA
jgi:hypothetical protein